jgi:hypothetical protein
MMAVRMHSESPPSRIRVLRDFMDGFFGFWFWTARKSECAIAERRRGLPGGGTSVGRKAGLELG